MSAHQAVEILLVEDSPDDAEMTIRALRKRGLANSLVRVEDGEAALKFLFGGAAAAPRLILLDLKLPKVSGLEVLKEIRGNESTRATPVVILTSSKETPDLRTAYDLGVNSYIVKPVDFAKFQDAVAEVGMYWLLLNQPPR